MEDNARTGNKKSVDRAAAGRWGTRNTVDMTASSREGDSGERRVPDAGTGAARERQGAAGGHIPGHRLRGTGADLLHTQTTAEMHMWMRAHSSPTSSACPVLLDALSRRTTPMHADAAANSLCHGAPLLLQVTRR